jgi:5-methylcytosine-specific restriction endonuclease McrA
MKKTPAQLQEYKHQWYLKNKERFSKKAKERYYSDEEFQQKKKDYCEEYRKRPIAKKVRSKEAKNYREKHAEKIREYRESEHYKILSKERNKRYVENNEKKVRISKQNNRVKRKAQIGCDKLSKDLVTKLLKEQNNHCFYCGDKLGTYHLDHIEPLANGGEHKDYNIVVTCPICNLRKGSKNPEEFVNYIIKEKDKLCKSMTEGS